MRFAASILPGRLDRGVRSGNANDRLGKTTDIQGMCLFSQDYSLSQIHKTEKKDTELFRKLFFFFLMISIPNMGLELNTEIKSFMLYQPSQAGNPFSERF